PSAANLPDLRLSALLPPLSERQQNATLIAQFLATNAASLRQFGLLPEAPEAVPPLPAPSPWFLDDLPALLRTLVATNPASGAVTLAIPNAALTPDEAALLPPSTRFVAPAALLSNWLTSATRRALRLLLLSFAALLLLLLFLYRRRALPILLVPLLGLLVPATAATLLLHRPINLFHLLAGFMLVGMALDYAIFLSTAASSARRSVLCAALTSTVAFGALAFVPLPLARSLALTLGLGIPASLLASLLLFPSTAAPQQTAAVEQSASPLGLRLAWLVYRLLGKRTLDRLTDLIALFVWLFNPTVRARAATFSRLRSFTQSLADKIVVMHGATNAPRVILPPPPAAAPAAHALPPDDAPAFLSAVRSRAGVLMISSHLGTIEVLPALGPCPVPIHAYMKAGRTDIFNAFYAAHADRPAIQIVPFDTFGIPEAIQTAQWLDEGHCVLFAGDRPFGRTLPVPLDAHTTIDLPAGVFRLAATLGHPAFFLCCLRVAPNLYHLHARAAPPPPATDRDIALAYARWLQPLIALHPSQWYHWSAN
ncbi:MAG: hypothetical protein J6Y19_12420, partial [Kiritimatiellae bacterium]|nr:hypothetical protein [Kiritimatiellia bacterium]